MKEVSIACINALEYAGRMSCAGVNTFSCNIILKIIRRIVAINMLAAFPGVANSLQMSE